MPVCPSVIIKQPGSHLKDFHEIWYRVTQKNGNFWKTPTKTEEIKKKEKLLTEIEPLQLAF